MQRICKNFTITKQNQVGTRFGNRIFFKLVLGGSSDIINQNNQNSNWKKILGFRNMQEKYIMIIQNQSKICISIFQIYYYTYFYKKITYVHEYHYFSLAHICIFMRFLMQRNQVGSLKLLIFFGKKQVVKCFAKILLFDNFLNSCM